MLEPQKHEEHEVPSFSTLYVVVVKNVFTFTKINIARQKANFSRPAQLGTRPCDTLHSPHPGIGSTRRNRLSRFRRTGVAAITTGISASTYIFTARL